MQQVRIGDKADELDAVRHTRFVSGFAHFGGKPSFLSGQHQIVFELRIGAHQAREGFDQTNLIFARLQIPHREQKRPADLEAVAACGGGCLARNRPELQGRGVGHHHHLIFRQIAVHFENRSARKLAAGEHPRGPLHGAAHGPLQLQGTVPFEIFGMFEEAHVVDAHYYRHITADGRGVLNVQKIRDDHASTRVIAPRSSP